MNSVVTTDAIINKIYVIRGLKAMLDRDLADLYEVETRVLNQAVRRHLKRFPDDFMFQLNKEEFENLKSQFVTSSWGGVRKMPLAFTEQGVAMLSGVLNSDRAIEVNIQIMRAFVKMRCLVLDNAELKRELSELKNLTEERFQVVFEVLDRLVNIPESPKRRIGYIGKEKID
ncbi:ORF6N domain-containing protein [Desulfatibacillum alkenivorans DSM 16219]|uniref:ORF6N domain-containing protein n=2 Tax=Desulfatibacillum alkenivorans TaxID=259354 RepID=A0A1M6FSW6_9BACT|nr:ORF6N domain-containing protein [Desulfatibacillum alkenivorans DSM 16219]